MTEPLLIEQLLPEFDAVRREHRVIEGTTEQVYDATIQADFIEAWKESHLVRFLFGTRSLAERVAAAARGREFDEPPPPDKLCLAELPYEGEWVRLGENPPHEVAFGVIGRFWSGETVWETIRSSEFQSFGTPGFAKIACNFSLRPYGAEHTLVTYECRTRGTDPDSTKGFLRYWKPLSPAIGVVLRAQLAVIG